ncbi:MAG TPA: HEAT repeat domain-containing protein [Bryobacteraceae bacterium]|nr:HEAT repeat domain-containing protein [Bryobacteraceae bacterium]
MNNKYTFILLALICAAPLAFSEDWSSLFRDAISRDRAVQDAAREKGLKEIVPRLMREDAPALVKDLEGITDEFANSNNEIRLQASAVVTTLAMLRPDGSVTLRKIIPELIPLLRDSYPRVRRNAATALSSLKPDIPVEAKAPLIAALKDSDHTVVWAAVYGVARFAAADPNAAVAVDQLLNDPNPQTQMAAVGAMAAVRFADPAVVNALIQHLQSSDDLYVNTALRAARELGPAVIKKLEPQIREVARSNKDPHLSATAADLLSQAEP